MRAIALYMLILLVAGKPIHAQTKKAASIYLLQPDRVFDGEQMQEGWQVLVRGNKIEAVGALTDIPREAVRINLKGKTLLPGIIEGHSHLFLHPYNETSWDDQVLKESRAERTARAVMHAKATLVAGFTTVRDLGTEGAAYDDAGLRNAIEKGVTPGPRMLVATKAIVATGSYGPKSDVTELQLLKGAAEVGGMEELTAEIRSQIGNGADLIKLYGDYRWGRKGEAAPTFSVEEITRAVEIAGASGRKVVVHATTPEAMRRAAMAGVSTIEHGDDGTPEIFALMKSKGVALCATIAAGEAVSEYRGWKKNEPAPQRIIDKRKSFAAALASGVTIVMGGDVGVYTHGDNAREMELMVEYGMKPLEVLRSATSVNADVFGIDNELGRIKAGLLADIIAVEGNPSTNISVIRKIALVMKNGVIYNLKGDTNSGNHNLSR